MKPIFEVLEREDLISDSDAFKILDWDAKRIASLHHSVFTTVFEHQYDNSNPRLDSDPFNYVASGSMRGDAGCQEIGCRTAKIDTLTRFAALYANRVAVPLSLTRPDDNDYDLDAAAMMLVSSIFSLLRSRPLIEASILTPTVMTTSHCKHSLAAVQELSAAAFEYGEHLSKVYADSFEVIYQKPEMSPSGKSTLYVSGPTDFLEHDAVALFDESATWRLKSWRYDKEGRVRISGPRKISAIRRIFSGISENTSFYLAYGLEHRARLLTDLAGETVMLEDLMDEDGKCAASRRAMKELDHSLPLLSGLPISKILEVRNEDRESFAAYRHEIDTITAEALKSGVSEATVRDFFHSRLTPKINKIVQELKSERIKQSNYWTYGAASLLASVGIGACGLPLIASVPLIATTAAVGTRLLGKAAEASAESSPNVRQRNDLFFSSALATRSGVAT